MTADERMAAAFILSEVTIGAIINEWINVGILLFYFQHYLITSVIVKTDYDGVR